MFFNEPGTSSLIWTYIVGYWHVFLLLIVFAFTLIKYYPKLKAYQLAKLFPFLKKPVIQLSLSLIIFVGGFGVARGLQGIPFRLASANDHVIPEYTSLVINTPFSIINTYGQITLEGNTYMSWEEAEQRYSPVKKYPHSGEFQKRNVCVIILESFASEYIFGHNTEEVNFTPFLDSLIKESLFCDYTIANVQNSRNALPAILTSIYPLGQFNFMESVYALNKVKGLPGILKDEGYHTSFFHGGHNGTMSFDKFTRLAEIDHYFGHSEYIKEHGKENYDGAWGIFDDAFFQYTIENLSEFEEPFFSTLFSLSSHDPYKIPEHLADRFPEGNLPMLKCIAYTDYSLKLFFEKAKTKPWYNNTLFVIVADHTSINKLPEYGTVKNRQRIPLLFYAPYNTELKGTYTGLCQQSDILPTTLDLLNYNKSFVAFGNSIFEESPRYSVNYRGVTYSITDSTYVFSFDGNKALGTVNYQQNLRAENAPDSTLERQLKAFIQNYEYRMINNKLSDTLSVIELIGQ